MAILFLDWWLVPGLSEKVRGVDPQVDVIPDHPVDRGERDVERVGAGAVALHMNPRGWTRELDAHDFADLLAIGLGDNPLAGFEVR